MWQWLGVAPSPDVSSASSAPTNSGGSQHQDFEVEVYSDVWVSMIPDEVLLHIFSYLRPKDLGSVAQVCQTWSRMSRDKYLKRGNLMVVGTEIVDFVSFGRLRSIESLIGRPLFGSWADYESRNCQDGSYLCCPTLNGLVMVELATAKMLWTEKLKGVKNLLMDEKNLYIIQQQTVLKCNKDTGAIEASCEINEDVIMQLWSRAAFMAFSITGSILFESFIVVLDENMRLVWIEKKTMEPIFTSRIHKTSASNKWTFNKFFKLRTNPPLLACQGTISSWMTYSEYTSNAIEVFNLEGQSVGHNGYSDTAQLGYNHLMSFYRDGAYLYSLTVPDKELLQSSDYEPSKSIALVESPEGTLFGILSHFQDMLKYDEYAYVSIKNLDTGLVEEDHTITNKWKIPLAGVYSQIKGSIYNQNTLIVAALPSDKLIPPFLLGIEVPTGKINWRVTLPKLTVMGEDAKRPDARLRLVGDSVHFSYLAFGMGFHVTVLNIQNGNTLFQHKRTWNEYHHFDSSECIIS